MGALLPFVPVGEQTDRSRAQEIVGPYEAAVGGEEEGGHISLGEDRSGLRKNCVPKNHASFQRICTPLILH